MAWFRPMGAAEVTYHQETVVGRGDDHPGAALTYYGSRGETPLRWGGTGAARLRLRGEVTQEAYAAAFGPGGFTLPGLGERLVVTRRPGFELVVGAHKSVAVLGVIDRADAMHSILDIETSATMDWLDDWFQDRGGRRGRAGRRTATGGLVYAVTRHGTSRAGDPFAHDHVLVANVAEMLDDAGGFKGLDSAALRDTVEAATMVGRLHSAARAVELGFEIEPDNGPSGRLRHWRIVGVPESVCEVFSKRSEEIAEHLAATGQTSYRARGVAARATRSVKRHTGVDELMPVWHAELEAAGWPVDRLAAHLEAATAAGQRGLPFPLTTDEIDALATDLLGIDGRLLAAHKVFTRTNLIAELAPRLYRRDPAELDRVIDRIVAGPEVVPLIGVAGAREQAYTTTEVLAAEATIAHTVEHLATQPGPSLPAEEIAEAVERAEQTGGHRHTPGQRHLVDELCGSGRAVTVVVGVAGSGKTTALNTATTLLETHGYQVLGTSTSGQAARTLGTEAGIDASTFASMLWQLDHGRIRLNQRTVVIVDEAGMADDTNLARLALATKRAGSTLVLVGDHHQLDAIGPGGALAALLRRHPEVVVTLDTNVRQVDPAEREALAELRDGDPVAAVAWYAGAGRIHIEPDRVATLAAMADAWAADTFAGHDTALLAWRRDDVRDLNRLARDRYDQLGHLRGDDVHVDGGRHFAIGDCVVALAPNPTVQLVTSEQLTITDLDEHHIDAVTSDGRAITLTGDALDRQHLDHAYALTIHRAQGATYDRAHVFANGGGRELAYVALSRARDHTTIHVTADDLGQALGDLAEDWGVARHQRWITDTPARAGHHPLPARRLDPAVAETTAGPIDHAGNWRQAHAQAGEPSPAAVGVGEQQRGLARRSLDELYADRHDLLHGQGRWQHTPAGHAARSLNAATVQLEQAHRSAIDPGLRRRDRRAATRALPALQATVDDAQQHWVQVGQPHADQLTNAIRAEQRRIDDFDRQDLLQRLDQIQARTATPTLGRDQALGL
jgi:conjugative relaxase-like TrwC/TraI family protein